MTKPQLTQHEKAEQQQFKAESEKARQAEAERNNQPHDIVNKTMMQRQSNHQHQQDGK
jgi:hypothetical protein